MFEPKSLTLGAAIGLVGGIVIAPTINLPDLRLRDGQQVIPSPVTETVIPKDGSSIPADEDILKAIFKENQWNFESQGEGASISDRKCDTSISTLYCTLTLSLPWAENPFNIDVSLGISNDRWFVKNMQLTR